MAAGLLAFFVALIASLLLVVPVRSLALRVGMVDLPGPRKVHLRPIPLLGGLAMYGAVMIAVLFAAVILLISGSHAQVFSVLVGGRGGYILDAVLTVVWIVGITASFSILDHMDGLCAGIAAVASASFAAIAYLNGQTFVATLAAAVLGAATGFLRWNFKPAKIFMGDGGAMFLGFLMATLALKLRLEHAAPLASWLVPVLILGVTIFDTTLVTVSRARRGLLPFATPGKDHAAHRLSNLGLGHRGSVLSLYLLGAFSGATALVVSYLPSVGAAIVGVITLVLIFAGVAYLERAPYERQYKTETPAEKPTLNQFAD
jgi:UDP-GlcNAc:undecaprenyl-phosphate GlcNAc-1-phosphate transferase